MIDVTWTHYDDIGNVIVLSAMYDDVLKKDETFTSYAVMLANRILEDLRIKASATPGKWGASLEPSANRHLGKTQLEDAARAILSHRSWMALLESTHVFTYGHYDDEDE